MDDLKLRYEAASAAYSEIVKRNMQRAVSGEFVSGEAVQREINAERWLVATRRDYLRSLRSIE